MLTEIFVNIQSCEHVEVNRSSNIDMIILNFKKKPIIVTDTLNERIYLNKYYNKRTVDWLNAKMNESWPSLWFESKYLPSKIWIGFALDIREKDLVLKLVDEFFEHIL